MKKISSHTFKHTIKDIYKNTESRKFCFVVGAGASVKSGIPTGGHLAEKWFKEIQERYSNIEVERWVTEVKLDKSDLAAHYGSIYRKRFETDKTSGYEFLVQAMREAKPTFGHIVLAQILAKAPGDCILTTNFDSLIETSIYQFTDKTPLVCGHESLSGYARPSNIHPLIIKIHRDLLLAPKSDPDEINKLDDGWKQPLDQIFSSHIPIVIGYGGNDGSLMSYIEQMNKPSNFFWCGLKDYSISSRVEKLIDKMGGSYVEIDGFDEIMQELLWVFDEIKPIKDELDAITKSRIETVDKQLAEINKEITKSPKQKNKRKKELSAFEYSKMANDELDFEKRKSIYIEALTHFPKTSWLWNEFTYFLHFIKKDYSNLEEYYLKALTLYPENTNSNGNYALFLNYTKKDYENAEKYYLKALAISPDNGAINCNYANFLHLIKKDYEKAEKYYLKALTINPKKVNGDYATFLEHIKKDYEKAEKYFIKSLTLDPDNAINNGNYAGFLLAMDRKEEATSYLEKAFQLSIDKNDLSVELWFYKYAHYYESINESGNILKALLKEGYKSIGWNLDLNVHIAIKNGHPNPKKLKEFSKKITQEES